MAGTNLPGRPGVTYRRGLRGEQGSAPDQDHHGDRAPCRRRPRCVLGRRRASAACRPRRRSCRRKTPALFPPPPRLPIAPPAPTKSKPETIIKVQATGEPIPPPIPPVPTVIPPAATPSEKAVGDGNRSPRRPRLAPISSARTARWSRARRCHPSRTRRRRRRHLRRFPTVEAGPPGPIR